MLPQRRRRVLITLTREDIFEAKGAPEPLRDPDMQRVRLSDIMLPADDPRLNGLWLDEQADPVTWTAEENEPRSEARFPVEVGHIQPGGWGCKVYEEMVPATKASSWGVSGMTHLICQRRAGRRRARRMHRLEVGNIFVSERAPLVLAEDDDEAISDFGNAAPARMVMPHADGIMQHIRPDLMFAPESMDQIIPPDTVKVCRGWMSQCAGDYKAMAAAG
jgi:hypothetical protein